MHHNPLTILSKAFYENGNTTDKNNFQNICANIGLLNNKSTLMTNENEINSTLKAKEALGNIYNDKPFKVDDIDQDTRESIARMISSKAQNMLTSERGISLLNKANEFHISYDVNNIDWLEMITEIDTYELLIEDAQGYNLDWDYSIYDPIGLEQEIQEYESQGALDQQDVYAYFCSSRGLEG